MIKLFFVINLIGLIASFALAHFLGRKLRGLIPKGKEFISLVCSLGILVIFYLANNNLFSLDKHSLLNAIYFADLRQRLIMVTTNNLELEFK